jgi:enterochelin esterase-like enzyme
MMITKYLRPKHLKIRCLLSILLLLAVCGADAADKSNKRKGGVRSREVSWVNSDLPAGPVLKHHVLESKAMGHPVGYVVWTPSDYDAAAKTRYPVIYFLHGMGGNESKDAGGFSYRLRRAIRQGTMPPVICAFPNGGRSGYRDGVERMIITELVPLIDANYRTKAIAKSRGVAGFSMGGAGSVWLSLRHPDVFGFAGSWGGGLWGMEDSIVATVTANESQLKTSGYAALLVNGDRDRPKAFQLLTDKFTASGITHEVVVLKDTPHNLGLYYERAGDRMTRFLGARLKAAK